MLLLKTAVKILYISHYFPPEMGAPAARVSELSRHWVQAGHDVTVLTGFPNHPDGVVRTEYRRHFRRGVYREMMDGIEVARTWLLPFPNRRPHERALNYSSFCLSAAFTGSFLSRPDVVIATSPQLLVGISGWWIAKCKRAPLVLEIRDLWPESLAAVGAGAENSFLHRGLARIARFLYRAADHIVVVTPAFRERLIEHWLVPPRKISLVPNGVETQLFSPRPKDPVLTAQVGAEGRFVVSYVGTLGLAHGLETLINTADRLQTIAPEILLLVVGDGAERERIIALANSKRLANIRFVSQQPREAIPAYISASDACLVLLKKSEVFETVIPTKMLEFMACGRPVIVGVGGEARGIVESSRSGISVPPENPDALCQAVLQLQRQPGLRLQLGQNGRSYIVERFSREQTACAYVSVLEELLYASCAKTQNAAAA